MTYDDWVLATMLRFHQTKEGRAQRWGQFYYNELPTNIAICLVATSRDPFYNDVVTAEVEEYVRSLWED